MSKLEALLRTDANYTVEERVQRHKALMQELIAEADGSETKLSVLVANL